MGRKYNLPDYYSEMRRLSGTYGIAYPHAGCYICQYLTEFVCNKCQHRKTCDYIHGKEKE